MEVMGYADRLSARPGERIGFMVSCAHDSYSVDIVRLDRSPKTPTPPGWTETVVAWDGAGVKPGRFQEIHAGSYLVVPGTQVPVDRGITLQCWVMPTIVQRGHDQGILSTWSSSTGRGVALLLDATGRLTLTSSDGATVGEVRTAEPLVQRRWYGVSAVVRADGSMTLTVEETTRGWIAGRRETVRVEGPALTPGGEIVIGALTRDAVQDGAGTRLAGRGCFNGKIDRPRIWRSALSQAEVDGLLAGGDPKAVPGLCGAWDALAEVSSRRVPDVSGLGHHAETVNLPTRAVPGANWKGSDVSYLVCPAEFQAIHYHEDDLEDCGWSEDFSFVVPQGLKPGIYAARLRSGDTVDEVPFYVRPAKGTETAVLYLASTNTYLAYGNEKLFRGREMGASAIAKVTTHEITLTPTDHFLADHWEIGASTYDLHLDGTGTIYSSRLRPVLTMRPNFSNWLNGEPRHFSGDLFLIEWFEQRGIAYDVATDEDLHMEGESVLSPHRVVVTGSHPEYWTTPMMDSLDSYLGKGGRMMYLGGNGFYWVTGMDANNPHVVEVRRGRQGTRAWTSDPGEEYLTSAPEPGGLWRFRGRTPNKLTGIGFTSQGWGGAEGYTRLPDSYDPRAAFVFEGIGRDEVIGDFGIIMGGAAGDELDRYDISLGTPQETLRLATTEGKHTDYYQLVIEDIGMIVPGYGGTEEPRVRADITLVEAPNGGAVFSVGSIAWSGSLPVNNHDNNVSRMTENVVRHFARES